MYCVVFYSVPLFPYPLPALRIVGSKKLPGGRGFSNTLTGDYVVATEPILRNVNPYDPLCLRQPGMLRDGTPAPPRRLSPRWEPQAATQRAAPQTRGSEVAPVNLPGFRENRKRTLSPTASSSTPAAPPSHRAQNEWPAPSTLPPPSDPTPSSSASSSASSTHPPSQRRQRVGPASSIFPPPSDTTPSPSASSSASSSAFPPPSDTTPSSSAASSSASSSSASSG
ncbi:hypothetical protein ACOMHN_033629 [Nucella lapillus]